VPDQVDGQHRDPHPEAGLVDDQQPVGSFGAHQDQGNPSAQQGHAGHHHQGAEDTQQRVRWALLPVGGRAGEFDATSDDQTHAEEALGVTTDWLVTKIGS